MALIWIPALHTTGRARRQCGVRAFAGMTAVLLSLTPSAEAVKHIKPGAYPKAKQDKIGRPPAARVRSMGSVRAAIIGGATGPKNVAVLLAQFPASSCGDCTSGTTTLTAGDLAAIDTYFTAMHDYYFEASYGNLDLTFKFFGSNTAALDADGDATAVAAGAYTMPNEMEYYGCGDEGVGCSGVATPSDPFVSANGNFLIRDALVLAQGVTTGPDAQGSGGTFHAVMVMHAGNGNETTLSTNGDIWSIFYSDDATITSGGGGFTQGAAFPETEASGITSPLGVMCHEFGHELGLPDLYNTTVAGGSSVVGDWEIMDSGPFTGDGANPAHPSAWSKALLGWVTPTVVGTQGAVSMGYVETNTNGMIRINVPNGLAQEYFLVEYRSRSSPETYDKDIPGDGLLVWHIDDAITSARGIGAVDPSDANTVNTGAPHYGVSIVSADGTNPASGGSAGNAFSNGDIFITPQSDNFAGDPSGVSIVNISGVGTHTATLNVVALDVSASQSILKAVNYPNPAGKGYSHPSGEGNSTIQFQLSRPAKEYSINLYTLSADLVRKIPKADITLNITRSADYKWVYEYLWNLTNGDGAHVAPGVYLYLIRADGESKSGKAVIIR